MPAANVQVVPVLAISLKDDVDNSSLLAELASAQSSNTFFLEGRTLYKDGSWNTICLPFALTADGWSRESLLEGATVMEFDPSQSGFNSETGVLSLYFNEVSELTAGQPYLIKWAEGDDIVNPLFTYKQVTATAPASVTSQDSKVSFVGN